MFWFSPPPFGISKSELEFFFCGTRAGGHSLPHPQFCRMSNRRNRNQETQNVRTQEIIVVSSSFRNSFRSKYNIEVLYRIDVFNNRTNQKSPIINRFISPSTREVSSQNNITTLISLDFRLLRLLSECLAWNTAIIFWQFFVRFLSISSSFFSLCKWLAARDVLLCPRYPLPSVLRYTLTIFDFREIMISAPTIWLFSYTVCDIGSSFPIIWRKLFF